MKIRILGRTIEVASRVSIYGFKNEKTLVCASYRKKDLKDWRTFKQMLDYCFMPYKYLEKKYL